MLRESMVWRKWLEGVGPEKRHADVALYKCLEELAGQLSNRMKPWDITIEPMWMAEYEDPEAVKLRIFLRPEGYHD